MPWCRPAISQLDGGTGRNCTNNGVPGSLFKARASAMSPSISHSPPGRVQHGNSTHPERVKLGGTPSMYGNSHLSGALVGEGIAKRVQFSAEQRRGFRDYFTAYLPGSSLHPDPPPPKAKKSVLSPCPHRSCRDRRR